MRRTVVHHVVRSAVSTRRLVGHRVGRRRKMAADPDIVAASGFGGARAQQQTGTERHKGGSPVSQRPRCNDSDHLLTNRSVLAATKSDRPVAAAARETTVQNKRLLCVLQGKNDRSLIWPESGPLSRVSRVTTRRRPPAARLCRGWVSSGTPELRRPAGTPRRESGERGRRRSVERSRPVLPAAARR